MRSLLAHFIMSLLLCVAAQPPPTQGRGAASERLRLAPQLTPGQTLRYQFEVRTQTEGGSAGLLENPQAPSQLELSVLAVVRLEVLSVESARHGGPGHQTHLRGTYEKSVATSRGDSYAPEALEIEEQYRKLQGRSIQFTLGPDGKLIEVEGLNELLPHEKLGSAYRDWLAQFGLAAGIPQEGILPGQKWSSEQPLASAPLAGMRWHTESTYLRNESCRPAPIASGSAPGTSAELSRPGSPLPGENCAVILTRLELVSGQARHDATPEEYRKRGLRTAGTWKGFGESLNFVSLRTGLVVSVTQTGLEELDVTIATADGQSRLRYTGRIRSESHLSLLSEDLSPP